MRRTAVLIAATSVAMLVFAGRAGAHPLGNLTTNSSTELRLAPEAITANFVLDLAELPTVQAQQHIDDVGEAAYRAEQCSSIAEGLRLTVDGAPRSFAVNATALSFPPGQGGLSTLRLQCDLATPGAGIDGRSTVTLEDTNFTDRLGWRELFVTEDGARVIDGVVDRASTTARLTAYPSTSGSTPRHLATSFTSEPGGPRAGAAGTVASPTTPQARGADGLTERFNRLVGDRDLTLPLGLLAAGLALVLGGLHALAPGHGKSLMAATVVSRRGTTRQVLTIGATVAVTHTAGVLALGSMIWASQTVAPDKVLPWLTVASGAFLAATGLALLIRRLVTGEGHHHGPYGQHGYAGTAHSHGGHSHSHGGHSHGDHDHDGAHAHDDDRAMRPPSNRWVVLMGVAGGIVPTPSALVVLLGATALGRAWFGVALVAVYGIGMAITLLAAGVALVRLQGWLERRWYGTRWLDLTLRFAPVMTAGVLMAGGLSIVARAAVGIQ